MTPNVGLEGGCRFLLPSFYFDRDNLRALLYYEINLPIPGAVISGRCTKKQGACTKHTIRSDKLEQAVLEALQQQISLAVEMDEVIHSINQNGLRNSQSQRIAQSIAQAEKKRENLERMKRALYPDWKNGDLSREDYLSFKAEFERDIALQSQTISNLTRQLEDLAQGVDSTNPFIAQFKQHRNLQSLTRPIVLSLIDMIYVKEGGQYRHRIRLQRCVRNSEGIYPGEWVSVPHSAPTINGLGLGSNDQFAQPLPQRLSLSLFGNRSTPP